MGQGPYKCESDRSIQNELQEWKDDNVKNCEGSEISLHLQAY